MIKNRLITLSLTGRKSSISVSAGRQLDYDNRCSYVYSASFIGFPGVYIPYRMITRITIRYLRFTSKQSYSTRSGRGVPGLFDRFQSTVYDKNLTLIMYKETFKVPYIANMEELTKGYNKLCEEILDKNNHVGHLFFLPVSYFPFFQQENFLELPLADLNEEICKVVDDYNSCFTGSSSLVYEHYFALLYIAVILKLNKTAEMLVHLYVETKIPAITIVTKLVFVGGELISTEFPSNLIN